MAAPTLVAQGTKVNGTGGGSAAWPVGHLADDIGILVVQTANQSVATPSGWTLFTNLGTGTAGAAGSVAIYIFWKRAASSAEADVTITDPGDHFLAYITAFRGCETSGSPFDGSAVQSVVTTPSVDVTVPNPTTTVIDTFVVSLVGNGTDSSSNQTAIGTQTWACVGLSGFTRIMTGNTTAGVGGGADAGGGTKATAGAVNSATATLATASAQVLISFALKPPQGGTPTIPTEGGIYVATGVKAAAGATGATTATLDTAAVQARITIALKPPVAAPSNSAPIIQGIPSVVGAVDNLINIPIVASDPDGDVVTLSLVDGSTAVPTGATLVEDEASGNFSIEWTPTSDQVGEWFFYVRATDDNVSPLSTDALVSVNVRPGRTNPFGAGVSGVTSFV